MKKYKLAIFIGRFQPFHNGHLYSLNKCLELAASVVVGIGSSNVSETENNPWDYETRAEMVRRVVKEEKLGESVVGVVPVPDTPTDSEWVRGVEARIMNYGLRKEQIVIVSNNEWVTSLMEQAGYEIYETGLFNREELEGLKIRELMRKGDEGWKRRVPNEVVQILGKQ